MNRINEIGDTPKGQHMLGRLSAAIDKGKKKGDSYEVWNKAKSEAAKAAKKHEDEEWFEDGSYHRDNNNYGAIRDTLRNMGQAYNDGYHTYESKNMTKKLIRLTESDLHRIVKESVNKVLREDVTDVDLSQIIAKLEELTQSGYIPFASPSPSSTEMIIKKNILQAIDCLKKAAAADNELYGQYS